MPERINPQSIVVSAALVLYYPASPSYLPYGDSVVALHFLTYFALPGGQSRICSAQQAEQPEQKESSAIS